MPGRGRLIATSMKATPSARRTGRPEPAGSGEQRAGEEGSPTQRYATLLHRVVAWEWDAAADRILASPNLGLVYGVATIANVSRGFTLVHPDDHDRHQALV